MSTTMMKFTRTEVETAYIEDHHGARRPALRAMERDLARAGGQPRRSVVVRLLAHRAIADKAAAAAEQVAS